MDKLIEGVGTLLGFIIFTLILKWWERRQAKQKKVNRIYNSSIEVINEVDRIVKHENRKIRDRHHAMRVYVIHFSNGTITEAGVHLLKVTFKHEIVLDYPVGVEAISKNFQEVPMPEMFLVPMYYVIRQGEYYLKDRNELSSTDTNQKDYLDWLRAYGVKSSMWLEIKKKGNLAAILVCHWPQPTDLDGTIIARIKDIKRNIEKEYEKLGSNES